MAKDHANVFREIMLDSLGGTSVTTMYWQRTFLGWSHKMGRREGKGETQQKGKSRRPQAWERLLHSYWLWGVGAHMQGPEEGVWDLQPARKWNLSSTAIKRLTQPTTWMSFKADSLPKPHHKTVGSRQGNFSVVNPRAENQFDYPDF